ncbi:Hypothetical protein SCLAV_2528 [Streptomyces clavuligerus]|uniref:Uncharacterized protein n=1 Tax=Streptomyces clavuligerus TaxID=1901 RepID=E2Q9M3_STRCL|nr:Hypothetical protein SCLAV_2528 [Streptomyces clavuligerus]
MDRQCLSCLWVPESQTACRFREEPLDSRQLPHSGERADAATA